MCVQPCVLILPLVGVTTICVLGYGAIGTPLVDETLRVLDESGIFSDDYGLLRRVAWIETEFGTAPGMFQASEFAEFGIPTGLWQMDNDMLQQTKGVNSLADIYNQIREELFGIIWEDVMYEDLNRPLYAALAVRLYLYVLEADIPEIIRSQSRFWYEVYHGETDDQFVTEDARSFLNVILTDDYPEATIDGLTGSKMVTEYNLMPMPYNILS